MHLFTRSSYFCGNLRFFKPSLPTLKLKDAADVLLYLGPRNSLVTVQMSPAELEGTPYGKEIERRKNIQMTLEK
jgi:hypothetical protein